MYCEYCVSMSLKGESNPVKTSTSRGRTLVLGEHWLAVDSQVWEILAEVQEYRK